MKEYVMLKRKKFRKNKLEVEKNKTNNNNIMVRHDNLFMPNKDFELLESLISDDGISIDTNKVIDEYYNICFAYCPKYLKTKLKNLNNKDDNEVIEKFEIELKKNFETYTSLYTEDEVIKIIEDFGSKIFSLIPDKCNDLWSIISSNKKKTIQMFINNIVNHIDKGKLENIINSYIYKYGIVAQTIVRNKESRWDDYIYTSVMTYLILSFIKTLYSNVLTIEEKKYEFSKILMKLNYPRKDLVDIREIIKMLFNSLKKVERKNLISFFKSSKFKIIELKKDSKRVREIKNFIGYVIFYLESYYFEDNEFYKSDGLMECLENHRNYLIKKGNNKAMDYSYEELEKSYKRRLLNY